MSHELTMNDMGKSHIKQPYAQFLGLTVVNILNDGW